VVVPDRSERNQWGYAFNLRVDDHPDPVGELRRLVDLQRRYGRWGEAHAHIVAGEFGQAIAILSEIGAQDYQWELALVVALALADRRASEQLLADLRSREPRTDVTLAWWTREGFLPVPAHLSSDVGVEPR
jgi:uncharacterized Ntn-hydrolase superfamily protein